MNFPRLRYNRSWIHGHHAVSILKSRMEYTKKIAFCWHVCTSGKLQHRPFICTPESKTKIPHFSWGFGLDTTKCWKKVFNQKINRLKEICGHLNFFGLLTLPTIKIFRRLQKRWKNFRFVIWKFQTCPDFRILFGEII